MEGLPLTNRVSLREVLDVLTDMSICSREYIEDENQTQYEFQIDSGWAKFSNSLSILDDDVEVEYWEGDEKSSVYFTFKESSK